MCRPDVVSGIGVANRSRFVKIKSHCYKRETVNIKYDVGGTGAEKVDALLEIKGIKKYFPMRKSSLIHRNLVVKAIDDVSITVRRGETLGLVGESGCGKSTLGRLIMRLEEPTAGGIFYRGDDIFSFGGEALKAYRQKVQMIFQDPFSSLNPRQTVADILGEPLHIHNKYNSRRRDKVIEMMSIVGLSSEHSNRYPHQFSGGQRQRIGIARALILEPELIVADESVSSLDVSIQAQILNLMKRLQVNYSLTYLFIAHDLGVVRHMSDRIAVMYMGRIVEIGESLELCNDPIHPYTRALLSAIPTLTPSKRKMRIPDQGEVPSSREQIKTGCSFYPRCPIKSDFCERQDPFLKEVRGAHFVACHY